MVGGVTTITPRILQDRTAMRTCRMWGVLPLLCMMFAHGPTTDGDCIEFPNGDCIVFPSTLTPACQDCNTTVVLGWFTKALEIETSVRKAEMVRNKNRSCQRQNVLAGRR